MRLIHVEGPDGAGKTTLINKLKQPGDYYIHNGPYPSPKHAYAAFLQQLKDIEKHKDDHITIFMDRWLISEQIYSVIKGEKYIGRFKRMYLFARLKQLNPYIIYCLPPYAICHKNWSDNIANEEIQDTDSYYKVYKSYETLADKIELQLKSKTDLDSPLSCEMVYDYTRDPI